jgi:hypothetical protein
MAFLLSRIICCTEESKSHGPYFVQANLHMALGSSNAQIVELVRREKNGFWLLQTLGAGDSLELMSVGGRLPVADIYEDASLVLAQE